MSVGQALATKRALVALGYAIGLARRPPMKKCSGADDWTARRKSIAPIAATPSENAPSRSAAGVGRYRRMTNSR